MIGVIIMAEGECSGEVTKFHTWKEANAFCQGVTEGANLYGAGSCFGLTLEDLESGTLNPKNEDDAAAIEAIKKHLLNMGTEE
jgi:hypothetical protein